MTNGEKLCVDFPNMRYTISEHRVITTIGVAASFDLDWWNAEYKEPTTERGQKINKSAMMIEIYMKGVNMCGGYQGCWVRFKEIEKIVDKYVR